MIRLAHKNVWFALLAVVVAGGIFVLVSLPSVGQPVVEPLRVGLAGNLYPLLEEAIGKKIFSKVFLDVTLHKHSTGTQSLVALDKGEVDVAIAGIGPLVQTAFDQKDTRILTSVVTYTDLYMIVARRDRGIHHPTDLKQHKLAVAYNATMRYFLENYLLEFGMTPQDTLLQVVPNVDSLPDMLARGEIDAFCARDPFVSQAVEKLGEQAVVFKSQGLPSNTLNLTTNSQWVSQRPDLLRRFLLGLIQLEVSGEQGQGVVLPGFAQYHVGLNQELVIQLENHARWQAAKTTPRPTIPNFMSHIAPSILHGIAPERVTLIH
ncbi:MAG: ABC transporter substrate-binding protein [Magnetococcales bacterium]|nr:ABC transporter substrate-binding protein [Magnetococcales bacterium]NGZ29543.1 ABC transporter substrate-binding protein [Magnetococcales bacterium]